MKKKNLILLLSSLLFTTVSSNAQHLVGFEFLPTYYNSKKGLDYENINSKFSPDMGVYYKTALSKTIFIKAGFGVSQRVNDAYFDFAQAKVSESFINLPVLFDVVIPVNEKYAYLLSTGVNLATIYKQEFLFQQNTVVPDNLVTKYGFGSYAKASYILSLGIKHYISDHSATFVKLRVQTEKSDLIYNPASHPAYYYKAVSLSIGLELNLTKKD